MKALVKLTSTFFYAGFFPKMPGTAGSAAGLLLALLVSGNVAVYLATLAILVILSILVIRPAEILFGKKDSGHIVIDEAAGIMTALLLIPARPVPVIIAFVLFRAFDIIKPFPVRRLEGIHSPFGVILDDIAAGIYANLMVRVALIWF
ncbi:MAG: phosphatidylglycerophosphatase A [Candidatus Omnitrophota bacterium]